MSRPSELGRVRRAWGGAAINPTWPSRQPQGTSVTVATQTADEGSLVLPGEREVTVRAHTLHIQSCALRFRQVLPEEHGKRASGESGADSLQQGCQFCAMSFPLTADQGSSCALCGAYFGLERASGEFGANAATGIWMMELFILSWPHTADEVPAGAFLGAPCSYKGPSNVGQTLEQDRRCCKLSWPQTADG